MDSNNKQKFVIELSAEQVGVLFEMCEFCGSAVHHVATRAEDCDSPPESFCDVKSIQDLLDDRVDQIHDPMTSEPLLPTVLEQAKQHDKPFKIEEFRQLEKEWIKPCRWGQVDPVEQFLENL